MQFTVAAEHGDRITVDSDHLGLEQGVVHVHINNELWHDNEIEVVHAVDRAGPQARAGAGSGVRRSGAGAGRGGRGWPEDGDAGFPAAAAR